MTKEELERLVFDSSYCPQIRMVYEGDDIVIYAGKKDKMGGGPREHFLQDLYEAYCAYIDFFHASERYVLYDFIGDEQERCLLRRALDIAKTYKVTVDERIRERLRVLEEAEEKARLERIAKEEAEAKARQEREEIENPIIYKGWRRNALLNALKYGYFEIKDTNDRIIWEMWTEGRL